MGKVTYATGIDHVSGSLAKPKVKDGHSCGSYLIGTHRVAPTTNPNFRVNRSGSKRSFERPHEDLRRPSRFRSSEGSAGRQKDHEGLPLEAGERGLR